MGLILSVIIPIYKVEKYLQKCVDSILQQDLSSEDYEIILIDDGSPDRCGEIADQYASQHHNIKVIHQENQGLSAARNAGIRISKGDYIEFVDSDDFLEPNVLGTLVAKMKSEDLDVLRFDYKNVNESYEIIQPYRYTKPFVDLEDIPCNGSFFLNERLGYACYVVQFIIKRSLIVNNKLFFKEGIYFEDTEWTPRMIESARKVTSIKLIVYNYLLRSGSITSSNTTDKVKSINDKMGLIDSLQKQSANVHDKRWYEGMIAATVISILSLVSTDFFNERDSFIKKMNSKGIFPLSQYHSTPRSKKKIKAINFSPRLFCIVYHIKNLL